MPVIGVMIALLFMLYMVSKSDLSFLDEAPPKVVAVGFALILWIIPLFTQIDFWPWSDDAKYSFTQLSSPKIALEVYGHWLTTTVGILVLLFNILIFGIIIYDYRSKNLLRKMKHEADQIRKSR